MSLSWHCPNCEVRLTHDVVSKKFSAHVVFCSRRCYEDAREQNNHARTSFGGMVWATTPYPVINSPEASVVLFCGVLRRNLVSPNPVAMEASRAAL